jgi:RHS repeat-associated protein
MISTACAIDVLYHPSRFTGKERDAESGNDYFGARYYASTMGRFLSPDWSAKVEPVPYAKLDNPQSLNLYTYMLDNPLSGVDPDGHSTLVFDGNKHTITLYSKSGTKLGTWTAYNNVAIHAPKGEGFQGHFTHGPEQNGTYGIRNADQHGGKLHVGEPSNGPFGSKGIVHFKEVKSASGATVNDDGIHAGRSGPKSLTGGCIRTTAAAMTIIQSTAPKDPLTSITVTNNQQNVQHWRRTAQADGDRSIH